MLLFCRKNNAEVSTYSVLTPTFIIEPFFIGFYTEIVVFNSRVFVVCRRIYVEEVEGFDERNEFFKAEVSYIKVGELFIQ